MNSGLLGYLFAIVLIYGLVTRLVIFIAARKTRTVRRVLITYAVMFVVFSTLTFGSGRPDQPPELALGFILAFFIWFFFDLWRVSNPTQKK